MQECSLVANVAQVNRNQRQAHVINLAIHSVSCFSSFAIHVFTPKTPKEEEIVGRDSSTRFNEQDILGKIASLFSDG